MPLPDELVLGEELIDAQHREFYARMEEFTAMSNAGTADETFLRSYLSYLLDYTTRHFRAEEAIMLEANYPSFYVHRREHFSFWRSCLAIQEVCESCKYAPLCAKQLSDHVLKWMTHHVQQEDRAYMEWIRAKADGMI
jgi:hemerythrin-like metal-binding protein